MERKKKSRRACSGGGLLEEVVIPHDLLVEQVLTRLPPKSLMRFKSVSKLWCSTICDPGFVKEHNARSRSGSAGGGLLMVCPSDHDDTNLSFDFFRANLPSPPADNVVVVVVPGGQLESVHQFTVSPHNCNIGLMKEEIINVLYEYDGHTEVKNGIICFYSLYRVAICNVSTHEIVELPPLASSNDDLIYSQEDSLKFEYHFEYVRASDQYKLLRVFSFHTLLHDGQSNYSSTWDILTLGKDTSWRSLPTTSYIHPLDLSKPSAYNNGINFWWHISGNCIMGFDYLLEEFQGFRIPRTPRMRCHGGSLFQFRNRLALVTKLDECGLELWVMEPRKINSQSSEVSWFKHLIEIPSTLVRSDLKGCYHPTGEILWTCVESESFLPLYSPDQEKAKIEKSVVLKFMSSMQPSFVKIQKLSLFAYEDNIIPLSYLINNKWFANNSSYVATGDSCG